MHGPTPQGLPKGVRVHMQKLQCQFSSLLSKSTSFTKILYQTPQAWPWRAPGLSSNTGAKKISVLFGQVFSQTSTGPRITGTPPKSCVAVFALHPSLKPTCRFLPNASGIVRGLCQGGSEGQVWAETDSPFQLRPSQPRILEYWITSAAAVHGAF